VIVSVAFSCGRAEGIMVRGLVFCPRKESRLILSSLNAHGNEPLDNGAGEGGETSRGWIEEHFDCIDPTPARIDFPPLTLKRYFAFARLADVLVRDNRLAVGFDVFVGPGELALSVDNRDEILPSSRAVHGFAEHNPSSHPQSRDCRA
jgi:hypothetical protein